jgi:hypothetical protein
MKVFTNTNFATGKAKATIYENRIVGLDTTDGNVIQAIADTVPIGVSHNYAADAGHPVTVIPLGAGFARVKSGMDFAVTDLGAAVGPDANGCAVSTPTHVVGILAGLSADVEGVIESKKDDDVVVLLCGCGGLNPNPNGTARFEALDGDNLAVPGVLITITIPDGDDLTGLTDENGIVEFKLPAGDYDWAATLDGHTINPNDGNITVAEGEVATEELVVTEVTPMKGTVKFTVLDGDEQPVKDVEIVLSYDQTTVDTQLTGDDGVADFEVDTGTYNWVATLEGYTFVPPSGEVTIPVGMAADPVDIVATYQGT